MICNEMEPQVERFTKNIGNLIRLDNIKNILDLGAADLGSSFALSRAFPEAKITAFECNPRSIKKCKENYELYKPKNITFIDKAVYSENKILNFYPVDMTNSLSKNDKAGSFFRFSPNYLQADLILQEDPIQVEAVKLKDYLSNININQIDIVWSDIQGAELEALKGMEDLLDNVRALHLEVEFDNNPVYLNHSCENEIDNFMISKDFEKISFQNPNPFWVDFIYINKKYKL